MKSDLEQRDRRPPGVNLTNSLWAAPKENPYPKPVAFPDRSLGEMFFRISEEAPSAAFSRYRELETDSWHTQSWAKARQEVIAIAAFLSEQLQVEKGEPVAIFSFTRTEWMISDLALLSVGAISIPVYHSLTDNEAAYILWDSKAKIVFAENQEQVEKLAELERNGADIPETETFAGGHCDITLSAVISFEEVSSPHFGERLFSFPELAAQNRSFDSTKLSDSLAALSREDLASIVYTSGTTGAPKGVVQTHGNHIGMLDGVQLSGLLGSGQDVFLFLPLAHSFARLIGYAVMSTGGNYIFPAIVDRKRSDFAAKIMFEDIKQSEPLIFPSVPRLFEKVMTGVIGKTSGSGGFSVKTKLLNWAIKRYAPLARKKSLGELRGAWEQFSFVIADGLVGKIRSAVFGKRLRFCISGGAPLGVEVARFFETIGVEIFEGYGLTETTPAISANTVGQNKLGTVGRMFEGVQVKIAESDGEILARGPNIAQGYYNQPQATAQSWVGDGWFATGDIGEVDEEGFLKITDRKKDLIVNAGGKNIAPALVEGSAKTSPYISQVLVFGDRKPYLVALITLEEENIARWADDIIPTADHRLSALAENENVHALIEAEIGARSEEVASYEQIKRFAIIPEDFTIENGLLSPTLKLKRKKVIERYGDLIEALYNK